MIFNISVFRLGLQYFQYDSKTFLSFFLYMTEGKPFSSTFTPRLLRFGTEVKSNNIVIQIVFHPLDNEWNYFVQFLFLWFTEYKTIKTKKKN